MRKFKARPSHYEIQETLGEGLTSRVYRALRRDPAGCSQHPVALKVLKSRNHVQVLQQEFSKLLKVRSKFCVQVLAWEELKEGPALVMEVVEGLPLQELVAPLRQQPDLVLEIGAQIQMGLQALHRAEVIHGDLNPKNILVSMDGLVKLIDFGFHDKKGTVYTTPGFAEPGLLQGKSPTPQSDFYALKQILRFIVPDFIEGSLDRATTQASKRRRLRTLVRQQKSLTSTETQQFYDKGPVQPASKSNFFIKRGLSTASFLCFLFGFSEVSDPDRFTKLTSPGSHQWTALSVNGLPQDYLPLNRPRLRSGKYSLNWQTVGRKWSTSLELHAGETFLLKPR